MSTPTPKPKSNRSRKSRRPVVQRAERVLIVDALKERAAELESWLQAAGFKTIASADVPDVPALVRMHPPDLIILDTKLTSVDWVEVCRQLRESGRESMPILLVAESKGIDWDRIFEGLAVAETNSINDFLLAPFTRKELLAKVETTLKVGTLQHELRVANSMLKELTKYLDNMVEAKVAELENVNRLRRFFSPQIVEAIVEDADDVLKEHRGEITVVFFDLRDFTPFAESHGPQEVFQLVRDFHETVGPIIFRYGGTLERFTGDGMMVFLGDPKPMFDHPYEAIRMALHVRNAVRDKQVRWAEAGYDLGLGIGIATGEATMGTIGFERRRDYAALGTPTNLAARLCSRALGGQILVSEPTHERVVERVNATNCGKVQLKGFSKPSVIFAVENLKSGSLEEID